MVRQDFADEGPSSRRSGPFVVVAVATTGRRETLSAVAPFLAAQMRLPDALLVCIAEEGDADPDILGRLPFETRIVKGAKGLCRQRNRLLDEIGIRFPHAGLVVFLDDDFMASPAFLAEATRLLADHPTVVLATGRVLADGIKTGGIAIDDAILRISEDYAGQPAVSRTPVDVFNAYGCNMVLRLDPVLRHGLRFDETLPLYSWLEDVDFSRALAPFGRIVACDAMRGVHLGTRNGRTSGVRFGYSQVANPVYLAGKKRISPRRAIVRIGRNLLANGLRLARPEPWVDRRGRLKGNLMGLRDLVAGRLSPVNILKFS